MSDNEKSAAETEPGNPQHIAVILDGNRRFAKKLMLKPWMGHEWGRKKVEKLLDWAVELGVKELTLYAFSVDNFNRPKEEFDFIMQLFREACEQLRNDPRLQEKGKKLGIRIRFLGRIDMFPADIGKSMRELMDKTKDNTGLIVNFCMAYGGRQEIIDAARKMVADVEKGKISGKDISEEMFKHYLYSPGEPEIVIRTGGEKRTSNFLIWQSNYSEWFFLEKFWPEFEKEDLIQVIEEFKQRQRRFGK